MMNKIARIVLIFVLCSAVTLPVVAENKVYLIPQQSNAIYCNTINVGIWVNATGLGSGQINLTYDSACANCTNWARNTVDFLYGTWQHSISGEWITFSVESGVKTGKYRIGTLTLHCVNNSQDGCLTNLSFIQSGLKSSKLFDNTGWELPAIWINGTFTCGELQQCLGTCCNNSDCTIIFSTDMPCNECINQGKYWKPNKDSSCFNDNPTSDLCLNWCPECCNGVDDDDTDTDCDFPADKECTCGLDPSESEPSAPVPEFPTIALFSIGLLVLTGYVLRKRA